MYLQREIEIKEKVNKFGICPAETHRFDLDTGRGMLRVLTHSMALRLNDWLCLIL